MPTADLCFVNATLFDGLGGSPREGVSVAVTDGRVTHVDTKAVDAKRTIDLEGAALTPGFIDMHSHSDYSVFLDPNASTKVRQGVTTEVVGNCGVSAAPIWGSIAREKIDEYRRNSDFEPPWTSMADYLGEVDKLGPGLNIAALIGYNTVRSSVSDDRAGDLQAGEHEKITAAVDQAMSDGAVGISIGLAYPSACFADADEVVSVLGAIAEKLPFFGFHIRDEGDEIVESIDEALEIAERTSIRSQISHIKTFGPRNWWKLETVIKRLSRARERGLDVEVDRYPYTAMMTALMMLLPKWSFEKGEDHLRTVHLEDERTTAKLRRETREILRVFKGENIVIGACGEPANKRFEGKNLVQGAELAGTSVEDFVLDVVRAEGLACFATFFGMSQENMDRFIGLDFCAIASDASVQAPERGWGGSNPHPRAFGCFPEFLGRYKADDQLGMAEAIRRITSLPAARSGLRDRGVVGEGAFADLCVLDPATVASPATYDEPSQDPTGIQLVVIGGKVAVEAGKVTGARSGAAIRSSDPGAFLKT